MYIKTTGVGAIFKVWGPTNAKSRKGPNGVKKWGGGGRAPTMLYPPPSISKWESEPQAPLLYAHETR